jgi:hypothetical protein
MLLSRTECNRWHGPSKESQGSGAMGWGPGAGPLSHSSSAPRRAWGTVPWDGCRRTVQSSRRRRRHTEAQGRLWSECVGGPPGARSPEPRAHAGEVGAEPEMAEAATIEIHFRSLEMMMFSFLTSLSCSAFNTRATSIEGDSGEPCQPGHGPWVMAHGRWVLPSRGGRGAEWKAHGAWECYMSPCPLPIDVWPLPV